MGKRLRVLAGAMTGAANEAPQRSGYVAGAEEDGPMEAVQRPGHAHPRMDPTEGVDGDGSRGRDGQVREEEGARQTAGATQNVSPALYGTGIVDRVFGQVGQVDLLQTGLNALAKVNSSGTIDEVNEGMEIVTSVQWDDLLGTDAFSYFTEPDRAKGWFMEALQGSSVRDKEAEIVHQEGETIPLTYNVVASNGNGQTGGVLLCRYRED